MNLKLHGGGLPKPGERRVRPRATDAVLGLGAYRVGGLGDGIIALAQVMAAKRTLSPRSVTVFGDQTTIRSLRYGIPEIGVQRMAGSYFMRNEQIVRDEMSSGYDLWLDLKPVPILRGKKAASFIKNQALVSDLEVLDREYFNFRGDDIRAVYRDHGCIGQMDVLAAAYGIEGSMRDAKVPTSKPQIDIPGRMVTISGGFGPTSGYKAWPAERWTEICRFLTRQGECPVQVGRPDEPLIEGAFPAMQLSLEEQFWLMGAANAHVGSDGFLCHVATALGVKTVVLWGPTPYEVWGHPEQIHVLTPEAENVWWTHFHWAWDDRCERMMRGIDTDMVRSAVTLALEKE